LVDVADFIFAEDTNSGGVNFLIPSEFFSSNVSRLLVIEIEVGCKMILELLQGFPIWRRLQIMDQMFQLVIEDSRLQILIHLYLVEILLVLLDIADGRGKQFKEDLFCWIVERFNKSIGSRAVDVGFEQSDVLLDLVKHEDMLN